MGVVNSLVLEGEIYVDEWVTFQNHLESVVLYQLFLVVEV